MHFVNTKKIKSIIWVTYLTMSLSQILYADDVKVKADTYNTEGVSFLDQEKIDDATTQFVNMLIVDPTNEMAQEYLRRIISSKTSITIQKKHQIERFMELLVYIEFLEARFSELKHDKERLENFITQHLSNDKNKMNLLAQIKTEEIPQESKEANIFPLMKKELIAPQSKDLKETLVVYTKYKDSLVNQVLRLEKIKNNLKDVRMRLEPQSKKAILGKDIDTQLSMKDEPNGADLMKLQQQLTETQQKFETLKKDSQEKDQRVSTFEDQLKDIQRKLSEKDKLGEEQSMTLNILQLELAHIQQKFVAVRDSIQHNESHVRNLKQQLADISLDLVDKDKTIMQKDDQIAHLSQQIQEIQERVLLIQRIMQEKDEKMQVLNETFQKNAGNYEQQIHASQAQIKAMQGELSALKQELEKRTLDYVLQREALRRFIARKLELAQRYRLQLKEYNGKVDTLQKSLLARDEKLADLDHILSSQDQKLLQLNGIVEIYKNKLGETYKILREKNEKIIIMEQQLEDLQKQLMRLPHPSRHNLPNAVINNFQSKVTTKDIPNLQQRLKIMGRK